MSLKTLPVLFLNLGGEMMYILDQRLHAQNISKEKSRKVMHDILATMLNKRFMDELFKPQEAYSRKAMRTVFDRLAHASIMRLNSASMDKLYDLMTMAFKYQVSLSKHPRDIMMITLNHVDTICEYAAGNDQILQQVQNVYDLIKKNYPRLSLGEYQLMRHTLLSFFQDMHIRVSIFLKDKLQTSNGRFVLPVDGQVPWGCEAPGTITCYDEKRNVISTSSFTVQGKYQLADKEGSFEIIGDRYTKLGTNMYTISRPVETIVEDNKPNDPSNDEKNSVEAVCNPLAKAELNLLNHMISSGHKNKEKKDFRLNLFDTDEQEQVAEQQYAEVRHRQVIVDATHRQQRSELTQLMDEFSIEASTSGDKGDDLLELMDSA